ncbi:hypothetical protein glysoja_013974 [Glycine soja]|nr:hypothetical protein glysoja_013974 [Glycine soja]
MRWPKNLNLLSLVDDVRLIEEVTANRLSKAERITNLLPPPPSSISRSESLVIMWVRSRSRFGSVVWRYLTATFL